MTLRFLEQAHQTRHFLMKPSERARRFGLWHSCPKHRFGVDSRKSRWFRTKLSRRGDIFGRWPMRKKQDVKRVDTRKSAAFKLINYMRRWSVSFSLRNAHGANLFWFYIYVQCRQRVWFTWMHQSFVLISHKLLKCCFWTQLMVVTDCFAHVSF